MDYLRWIEPEDVKYSQEAVSAVSSRAKRILSIFEEVCPVRTAVSAYDLVKLRRKLRKVITNRSSFATISGELQAMQGTVFSRPDLITLACSIAGSTKAAASTTAAGILSANVAEVDCWAFVRGVTEGESIFGEPCLRFDLLICNSPLAGNVVWGELGARSARSLARRLGLLGSYRSKKSWYTFRQFIDSAMLVRISKVDGQIYLAGNSVNASVLSHNQKLSNSRSRKHSACHFGAIHDCGDCGVGRNQCERSCNTEKTNYELG
jgi:hypothetical protein